MLKALSNQRSNLALAGIIAPLLYLGQVVILGLLEPEFNQRTMMMSVLGGVPGWRGAAFNIGLILIGTLLVLFGIGLYLHFDRRKKARWGLILLAAAGIGLAGSSYFHCNAGCANVIAEPDFQGKLHMLFAFIAGLSLAFAPLAFFFSMNSKSGWKGYRGWTLLAVVLSNIPGIVMWVSLFTIRLPEWEGLIQRLGLLFPMIWVEATAWKLFSQAKVDET